MLAAALRAAGRLRERPGTDVDQTRHELPVLLRLRAILGIVFYGAILDWLAPGTRFEAAVLPLPGAARWAGVALAVAGALLVGWSMEALGPTYRGGVGLWDDHRLVTGGPYRWIRHPMYVGFVATTAGVGLLSASWPAAVAGILLTVLVPALRVSVEEAELAGRFGEPYRRWARRTGRYVLRLRPSPCATEEGDPPLGAATPEQAPRPGSERAPP